MCYIAGLSLLVQINQPHDFRTVTDRITTFSFILGRGWQDETLLTGIAIKLIEINQKIAFSKAKHGELERAHI